MIILPKFAVENDWVSGLNNPVTQLEGASIDFTLDNIYRVFDHNSFHISEDGMKERGASGLMATPSRREGVAPFWCLKRDDWYIAESNLRLELPADIAVLISTLPEVVQNGVVVLDRMLPAGYSGILQFTLNNLCGETFITPGTRIGTLTFVEVSDRYPTVGVFA